MRFLIKQNGPDFWYFVLLGPSGEAIYVSPVRYRTAADAERVVLALRSAGSAPVTVVADSVFRRSRGVV